MTQNSAMTGEKIYEFELALTGVTDFGVSMDAILSRKETVPLHGARFDLMVEGRGKGRISGQARGVDYLRMRADGRIDLDLHVTIETDDGHRIALSGDGQAAPRRCEPVLDIFANIRLSIVGHLTAVSDRMLPLLGKGERRFPNLDSVYLEHPDRTEEDPLAPTDLKAAWQDLTTRLTDALEAFTPEEWLQKHTAVSDADFAKDPGRNRMAVVLSRTNHISYHMGQLMLTQNPPRT